jgi:thymidylate synthase
MNNDEQQYLNLLKNVLENGSNKSDRTGIGTKSIFGTQLRFSLENNILPVLTTKKVFTRGVIEELLFFIRGETDTKLLEAKGVNIWKGNTSRKFLDQRGLTDLAEGEMGPMYGAQWRSFFGVDQLSNAFNLIKNDPDSRRILITALNPAQSHLGVLEPCHTFFQFYVNNNELSCQFYCRSQDLFLGTPFNIMSYALLTHIMAKATGLAAKELIYVAGDAHLYNNHFEQVKEQLSRKPYSFPTIQINKNISSIKDIENLLYEDFKIEGYRSHSSIKAEMAI